MASHSVRFVEGRVNRLVSWPKTKNDDSGSRAVALGVVSRRGAGEEQFEVRFV